MAIRLPDENYSYRQGFADSQLILLPIHENRIGQEDYEQMLREAMLQAKVYDKIVVGVLEAYCSYENHPILGNIPVLPREQAGSGSVARPLTVYETREEAWRAVARGLAELLEPNRPFFKRGIQGQVYYDTTLERWIFDKGRKDGASIWHKQVEVSIGNERMNMRIQEVDVAQTILEPLAGFDVQADRVLQGSILTEPTWAVNVHIEDHAGNSAWVKALSEDKELQDHGLRFTRTIPDLDYNLHLTQTHAYLTRAFEDPNQELEELYLNPYRPLTKPLPLSQAIKEFLKQAANWEFLKRLEALYREDIEESALEIRVLQQEEDGWQPVGRQGHLFQLRANQNVYEGGEVYFNPIRIELVNRHSQKLYISPFLLSNYLGSDMELTDQDQLELEPEESLLLFEQGEGTIPVELARRTLVYNLPHEDIEVKILASPEPFSTAGYWMKHFPGPPGSDFREEEGYFMEKAMNIGEIRPLEGTFIAPLLRIRLENPAYNKPDALRLEELLRRPDAEPFMRALYYESFSLAPRYELKQKMELRVQESPGSKMEQPSTTAYVHTPNWADILEHQMQQLQASLRGKAEKPILFALGDSWFNQAEPVDISRFLMEDFLVLHAPLTDWEQLEVALLNLEKNIAGIPSVTLLLSPGGEALVDNLEEIVRGNAPDDTGDIRKILKEDFSRRIAQLMDEWDQGFKLMSGFGSRLQVVVHAYDYFPLDQFGGALYERPREWRRDLIAFIVDTLNARLRTVVEEFGASNIHYLGLRRTLEPQEWRATLIPGATGFRKLASAISLFISQQYGMKEEPYPGTEYFLWQAALIDGLAISYQQLIEAYPEGEKRAWAEEQLELLQSESLFQSQSQTTGSIATPEEPDALQALRHRANELISSNQLGELLELLDRELLSDSKARERLEVYHKEYEEMEQQRRRYKRPSKQLERDMASLADAVGELVEGLAAEELGEMGSRKSEEGTAGERIPSEVEGSGTVEMEFPESAAPGSESMEHESPQSHAADGSAGKEIAEGDIFLGKVKRILPQLNAAFIDIGEEKEAFLHYTDLGPNFRSLVLLTAKLIAGERVGHLLDDLDRAPQIAPSGKMEDVLKKRQPLLVQILKEPEGNKGARLTCEISLVSQHLVLALFSDIVAVSKKIDSSEERKRLQRLIEREKPQNFGVVVRTSAASRSVIELRESLADALKRWEAVCRRSYMAQPPLKVLAGIIQSTPVFEAQIQAFPGIHKAQSGQGARFFVIHGREDSGQEACCNTLKQQFLKGALVYDHSLEDVHPETDPEEYWKKLITRAAKEKGLEFLGDNIGGIGTLFNQVVKLVQGQPTNIFVLQLSIHHRHWNEGIPALIRQQLDNQRKARESFWGRLGNAGVEMDFFFVLSYDDKTREPMLNAFEELLPGCILPEVVPPGFHSE